MPASAPVFDVATVTLNPAIDRTVTVHCFTPGAVNRAEAAGDRPGGKGVNVAAALAEQGFSVAALGFLGRDNDAGFTGLFTALGVEDRCLRLPGATRTGIKIVDPARGETTDLNFPGLAPGAGDLAELGRRLDELDARWCVLAGSLPPGVPADFYHGAILRLKARGVGVALDTSGEALRRALPAAPDLIKPNVHELSALVGRELPDEAAILAAAREVVAGGIPLVVVSCGADGAYFVDAGETVVARPPRIAVRSTVGAGDAMVAGVVAARLQGRPLAECARLATAWSLFALSRAGGGPEAEARASVAAFAGQVEVVRRPAG